MAEFQETTIVPTKPGVDFTGREWEVTIIGAESPEDVIRLEGREYFRSKNGRLYSCEALSRSARQWEGIKVYDNHLTEQEFEERAGMRSVAREWVGSITQPWWDKERRKLRGTLKVVDEGLARKLKNAWDQGILSSIGLSIDTIPDGRMVLSEGQRMPVIEGFRKILSVDLVAEPAAGGGFNRLIAANQILMEASDMEVTPEFEEYLKSLIQSLVAEALAGSQVSEQVEEEEEPTPEEAAKKVEQAATAAAAEVAQEAPPAEAPEETAQKAATAVKQAAEEAAEEVEEEVKQAKAAMEAVRKLECKLMLKDKLDAAKLPPALRGMIESSLAGKIFKEAEVDQMVKRAKEAQAQMDPSGRVAESGGQRGQLQAGMSERDVAEVEFLRLIAGNTRFRELESVKHRFVQERITESYRSWVRSGRPNYGTRRLSEWVYNVLGGDPLTNQRAFEAVTTSSMSSIVKNALNVLLAADYAKRHMWWEPVVRTEEVDTIDQATLVRVYGMDTLSVVNEGAAYTELGWEDEEETAAFVKKGNFVGITIETLLRDKVNKVRAIPENLATSWYNTISALVSGVFTVNSDTGPELGTTGALFNATAVSSTGGHANLLTAALNFTNFGAARTAMMKQTDQTSGSGQKLLIAPKFLLVPTDLETAALQIRNSEQIPGSADNDINPYYQKFEVVVVPNWSDADNWALVGDPNMFPAIWLIFLRGRRVPELFTADSETVGAMFTNDTLRYKVRMLTWRFSSTYDCAPVSDFRPLHKNNVS